MAADHLGLEDDEVDSMSEEDFTRLQEQQHAIGLELIRRSGIDPDIDKSLVIAAALGTMPDEQSEEDQ